jgi:hypothetical protein
MRSSACGRGRYSPAMRHLLQSGMPFRCLSFLLFVSLLAGCGGDTAVSPPAAAGETVTPAASDPTVIAIPFAGGVPFSLDRLARELAARDDLFTPAGPAAGAIEARADSLAPAAVPAALTPGLIPPSIPPPAPVVTGPVWPVGGRVWHGEGGVPGVVLHLLDGTGENEEATATSDNDGAFAFSRVPEGRHLLLPVLPGQAVEPAELMIEAFGPLPGQDLLVPSFLWYVSPSACALTRDGLSWQTAFAHPQQAVDVADSLDRVLVAAGTYGPLSTADRRVPVLRMKEGIAVHGGFAGYETGGPESRDCSRGRSVLDGLTAVDHVVTGASRAFLSGFTITGGRAIGENGQGQGGGMYNESVTGMAVSDCAFMDNDAAWTGGAVHNLTSRDLTFERCLFTGNIATWGGAVSNGGCGEGIAFVNCTFARNAGVEGSGAALLDDLVSSSFISCIIWGNHPPDGLPLVRSGDDPLVTMLDTFIDSDRYPGEGNRTDDPLFAAADSRDFRLLPISPAEGRGSEGMALFP